MGKQPGLILRLMTSQSEKQTITMHELPNISRSKDNQTKLVEYNVRK